MTVPRDPGCPVCSGLADITEITDLILGGKQGGGGTYLAVLGIGSSAKERAQMVKRHRDHARLSLAHGDIIEPEIAAPAIGKVRRIEPLKPVGWDEANQTGIAIGAEAAERVRERLDDMKDANLIAVMKIGQSAAVTRASLELKGAIKRKQAEAAIASGYDRE